MNAAQSSLADLLALAKNGDRVALGSLLGRHRGFLKVLAERVLNGRMRARVEASDVVQQTCLLVHAHIGEFRGETPAQFIAWLQKIHAGHVKDALREHLAQKRDIGREAAPPLDEIDSIVEDALQSTPSQRVLRDERAVLLAEALDELPNDQREAVRLRFFEGLSLREIHERTGRSEKAASALIRRGMDALRKLLRDV